jgi:hypothetical protein
VSGERWRANGYPGPAFDGRDIERLRRAIKRAGGLVTFARRAGVSVSALAYALRARPIGAELRARLSRAARIEESRR